MKKILKYIKYNIFFISRKVQIFLIDIKFFIMIYKKRKNNENNS